MQADSLVLRIPLLRQAPKRYKKPLTTIMKLLTIIGFAFLLFSCQNKSDNYIISASNDTIKIISVNWNNHENAPGKVVRNLYLELEDYKKVHDSSNPNIKIRLGDNLYTAHGIGRFFSREIPESDFFYTYKNKTKELVIDIITGKPMMEIAPVRGSNYNLPKNLKINELYD
jgi:hypothetical protein